MSIVVSILSTFNNKGLKSAEKQTGLLTKSMNKLGIALASALSVRKVSQFAKESARAFLEEDKAIKTLGNTLKNLSLAYNTQGVERFISETQAATGVLDNELRPAFAQLAMVTRNLGKTQELLNLSLDISAATGKSLASVTAALSRAYAGNTTSLSRLNIGLTKTELTTESFDEIVSTLTKRFRGSATTAAATYEGKIKRLNVAFDEAKETVGQGLVKAVDLLIGQEDGIQTLADVTGEFAENISNAALGIGVIGSELNKLTNGALDDFTRALMAPGPLLAILIQIGKRRSLVDKYKESQNRAAGRFRKQQRIELGNESKITSELNKQLKAKQEAAKLDKAKSVLDLEKIQIETALQGDITENEKLRLQLMKAILNENTDRAATLAEKLGQSQAELAKFKLESYSFKPESPFDAWLVAIEAMRKGLASIGAPVSNIPGIGNVSGTGALTVGANVPEMSVFSGAGFITPELASSNPTGVTQINVNVTANDFLSQEAKQAVVDAVVEASSAGFSTGWFRTTGQVATL